MGKSKKRNALEKKLEVPFPLSVWWYLLSVFLLFFGIYIYGMHFLTDFVNSKGGTWSIFTTKRPHLTPYSGPQDIRWGSFYIPSIALNKYYAFAPFSLISGIVMLSLRFLFFKLFVKKHSQ